MHPQTSRCPLQQRRQLETHRLPLPTLTVPLTTYLQPTVLANRTLGAI